jgi:lipoprotein-anchoring transpeptidase ErfK/SrfK
VRSLANKIMVNTKFLFNQLIVLSLSVAALSVALQQQATAEPMANSSNSAIAQQPKSEVKLPNLLAPELPPLSEPSQYIPQEQKAAENPIEEVTAKIRCKPVFRWLSGKTAGKLPRAVLKSCK